MIDVLHLAGVLLLAGGLLLPVRLPWGGSVPMGVAAIAATTALTSTTVGVEMFVAAGAVAVAGLLVLRADGARTMTLRFLVLIAGAVAADVTRAAFLDGDHVLTAALVASAGIAVADLGLAAVCSPTGRRLDVRAAVPVHLTLACAGALIAVSISEVGVAMAAVAAFPLLITRFSFERYAGATDTLDQTVQALGLVPELAGLVPLGHSERSAAYADALAGALGFDRATTSRVVTATRLHHLGAVPDGELHDQLTTSVAQAGARILRNASFPADVVELLGSADAESLDAVSPSLEAAVVRVAAIFDELVGEDAGSADRSLAMVAASARDVHSRRVAAALLGLAATDRDLVTRAIDAAAQFRDAATGLDLQAVAAGRGVLLPFARRA